MQDGLDRLNQNHKAMKKVIELTATAYWPSGEKKAHYFKPQETEAAKHWMRIQVFEKGAVAAFLHEEMENNDKSRTIELSYFLRR